MIAANKSRLFSWWFARHAEARMRRMFSSAHVFGLAGLRARLEAGPVIVVSNHSAWWDPMFAIVLAHRVLRTDGYALMEASNLRRLPFLGRVGGFGVERDVEGDGEAVVRYAAGLLDRPNRLVWIFPQGDEHPITEPLRFHRGAAAVGAHTAGRAHVVPAALRYEFGNLEQARLFASFGTGVVAGADVEVERARQRDAVAGELAGIDRAVRGAGWRDEFEPMFTRRRSAWGAVAERMLAWVTRP